MFKILFAPMQGYTTSIYRNAHANFIGGIDTYYAPFLRVENGNVRTKDLYDLKIEKTLNTCYNSKKISNIHLEIKTIPQIIANSVTEFKTLVKALQNEGFNEIDFNMGCPFPMQVNRHRGAGLLSDIPTIKAILEEMVKYSINFSIKMRLGQNTPHEAFTILPFLNKTPLKHITLHPRLGKQQYKGALDISSFERFYNECNHPLIFNGEITNIEQINKLKDKFPNLNGVMIGRGLLANPFLAKDYKEQNQSEYKNEQNKSSRMSLILKIHQTLVEYACHMYQGESQILSHLKNFWDYQEIIFSKKALKEIKQSRKIQEYISSVSKLEQGIA